MGVLPLDGRAEGCYTVVEKCPVCPPSRRVWETQGMEAGGGSGPRSWRHGPPRPENGQAHGRQAGPLNAAGGNRAARGLTGQEKGLHAALPVSASGWAGSPQP